MSLQALLHITFILSFISPLLSSHIEELKMAQTFRMAIAILGNAASVCLFAAPMVTFKRIIRKKSTEEFSCLPYIIGLLNCLIFTWYGLPIVSNKWENFPLVTVNGVGIVVELAYVLIYFWYASSKGKVKVALTAIPVIVVFCIIAIVSTFSFHDNKRRKLLVGSVGFGVSVAMYASPLVVMKKVIKSKSVEFMPLPLSLCSFVAGSLWMTYGFMIRDIFVAGPSVLGVPLAILQLVLHCKYWKRKPSSEEGDLPNKLNMVKGDIVVMAVVNEGSEMVGLEKGEAEMKMSNNDPVSKININ